MKGHKDKLKSGFEVDCILARHVYCYSNRAGVAKKAKKQINKRDRANTRQRLLKELYYLV